MVVIRPLRFNEWITPLQLSSHILDHTPQPWRTLLMFKLPISLLILKIHDIDTIYVAEENNQIIGMCIAQIQENQLIIEGTVIAQEHRRRGISGQLKKAVEQKAKQLGAETSITKIEPDNNPAIQMAIKQGYHTTIQEKIYEKTL